MRINVLRMKRRISGMNRELFAKHLLLVGGGHAHMVTLAILRVFIEKGYKVTIIGSSAYL